MERSKRQMEKLQKELERTRTELSSMIGCRDRLSHASTQTNMCELANANSNAAATQAQQQQQQQQPSPQPPIPKFQVLPSGALVPLASAPLALPHGDAAAYGARQQQQQMPMPIFQDATGAHLHMQPSDEWAELDSAHGVLANVQQAFESSASAPMHLQPLAINVQSQQQQQQQQAAAGQLYGAGGLVPAPSSMPQLPSMKLSPPQQPGSALNYAPYNPYAGLDVPMQSLPTANLPPPHFMPPSASYASGPYTNSMQMPLQMPVQVDGHAGANNSHEILELTAVDELDEEDPQTLALMLQRRLDMINNEIRQVQEEAQRHQQLFENRSALFLQQQQNPYGEPSQSQLDPQFAPMHGAYPQMMQPMGPPDAQYEMAPGGALHANRYPLHHVQPAPRPLSPPVGPYGPLGVGGRPPADLSQQSGYLGRPVMGLNTRSPAHAAQVRFLFLNSCAFELAIGGFHFNVSS